MKTTHRSKNRTAHGTTSRLTPHRRLRAAAVLCTLGVMGGLLTGTSSAQTIPDAPPLGFTIDPERGAVGSTVTGQVAPADIADHCLTTPEAFAAQFGDPMASADAPGQGAWIRELTTLGEIMNDPNAPASRKQAVTIGMAFPLGLWMDLNYEPSGVTEDAMRQTMILAFADLATARPIAPYGSFDPVTGEGSTVVPDIAVGGQVVIATCVGLPDNITTAQMSAALDVATAYIEEHYDEPYPNDPLGPGADAFMAMAQDVVPVMLGELVVPKALGIAPYCIDDGAACDPAPPATQPSVPGTPPTTAPNQPGTRPGNGANRPSGSTPNAPGARAVTGSPSYTG